MLVHVKYRKAIMNDVLTFRKAVSDNKCRKKDKKVVFALVTPFFSTNLDAVQSQKEPFFFGTRLNKSTPRPRA